MKCFEVAVSPTKLLDLPAPQSCAQRQQVDRLPLQSRALRYSEVLGFYLCPELAAQPLQSADICVLDDHGV